MKIINDILTSSSSADVAVGRADNFSVVPSTQDSSFGRLECNFVIIPMEFSQPTILKFKLTLNYIFLILRFYLHIDSLTDRLID